MKRALIALTIITTLFTYSYSFSGTIPAGLPSHFGMGAIDKQDTYSPDQPSRWKLGQNATCPVWDYNYQYVVPGWPSWVADGGWFVNEMTYWEAQGQIMVATYYYSYGATSYFTSTSNMTTYWRDLKLLFQKIQQHSTKKVIVHFEPDGIGFWKQANASPTGNGVVQVGAVASAAGVPELNGLPNTLQGWSEGIKKMRDAYAPTRALLAHHFTHWATGTDLFKVDTNSDSQSEVDAEVKEMTDYILAIENGKPFDLFFIDPSDRDAAWYDAFGGGGRWTADTWDNNSWSTRTWGRIGYICDRVSTNLGKRGMFWQIPIGNDYYTTCNNTDGHYKDDHAQEAFLRPGTGGPGDGYDPADTSKGPGYWAGKGMIAVLFGSGYYGEKPPGGNNLSHLRDYKKDGITGNGTHSDDDGGYIRNGALKYCQKGKFPLSGSVITPTPIPSTPTRTVTRTNTPVPPTATFTRTATGTNTPVPPTATFTRTATRTNTPVPPTSTFTASRTNTPVPPTFTSTATRTNTSVPPTDTYTATRTNTAVPPTVTFTSTATRTHTQVINSPTVTNTAVPPTATFTRTATSTNTVVVPTATRTATRTATMTATDVPPNSTFTFTATITNTVLIPSATPTRTATMTNTSPATFSATPTVTMTHTAVPPNSTATSTPSITNTVIIPTATPSSTATRTSTATSTLTNVPPANTFTATATRTAVVTPTPTEGRALEIPAEKPVVAYPNPFKQEDGGITIEFTVTKDADSINIKMYTVSGRLVRSIDLGSTGRGEVSVSIDKSKMSGLAKGVYYYKIWARAGNEKAESTPQKLLILN